MDPCCGSGTIPIEAAMIARNIAPGLNRNFVSEEWEAIPAKLWKEERKKAYEVIDWDSELEIYAYDIDKRAIESAQENAAEAGVEEDIIFTLGDGGKLQADGKEGGVIVTNPPYGERIGDRESIDELYKGFNKFLKENKTWSMFAITPDKTIEDKVFNRPADRRRKLFNGRMEVCYYQYHGQKPEKKKENN